MKKTQENAWHAMDAEAVLAALRTDAEKGLLPKEAMRRRAKHGENAIWRVRHVSVLDVIKEQVFDLGTILLGIAAVFSAMFSRGSEAVFLLALLLSAAFIRTFILVRSYRTFENAARENVPTATILRDGSVSALPADAVVPGDIVRFRPGDPVVADVRLLSGTLTVTEVGVTENRAPQIKSADFPVLPESLCEDRSNILFAGSTVVAGQGTGVVFASGEGTYIYAKRGHISVPAGEELPLVSRLSHWCRRFSLFMIFFAALTTLCGILLSYSENEPVELLLSALSLCVASMSEFLSVIGTAALAGCVERVREDSSQCVHLRTPKAVDSFANAKHLILSSPHILGDSKNPESQSTQERCEEAGIKIILMSDTPADTAPEWMADAPVFTTVHSLKTYLSASRHGRLSEHILVCTGDRNERIRIMKYIREHLDNCVFVGDVLRDVPCFRYTDASIAVKRKASSVLQCLFSAADAAVFESEKGDGFNRCLSLLRGCRLTCSMLHRATVYMLSVQSLRLTLALATVLLGLPVFLPTALLWWGLILDLFAVLSLTKSTSRKLSPESAVSLSKMPSFRNGLFFPVISGILTGVLTCFVAVFADRFLQTDSTVSILYAAGLVASALYLFLSGEHRFSSAAFFSRPFFVYAALLVLTLSWVAYAHFSWLVLCAFVPAFSVPALCFLYRKVLSSNADSGD